MVKYLVRRGGGEGEILIIDILRLSHNLVSSLIHHIGKKVLGPREGFWIILKDYGRQDENVMLKPCDM